MAGRRYYTCLDCNWGFWNIPLAEESREITAFLTPFGSFEFNVLPFGLKVASSEYQAAMDSVFRDRCIPGLDYYIDDMVLSHNLFDLHCHSIDQCLAACVDHGLFIKLKKGQYV